MPLSDVAIRTAKPAAKPLKLADERGLFLFDPAVRRQAVATKVPDRRKGKEAAFRRYPDVSLKEARKPIAVGVDPSEKKRSDRIEATSKAANTFAIVAEE